jgi:hypothetical protein
MSDGKICHDQSGDGGCSRCCWQRREDQWVCSGHCGVGFKGGRVFELWFRDVWRWWQGEQGVVGIEKETMGKVAKTERGLMTKGMRTMLGWFSRVLMMSWWAVELLLLRPLYLLWKLQR